MTVVAQLVTLTPAAAASKITNLNVNVNVGSAAIALGFDSNGTLASRVNNRGERLEGPRSERLNAPREGWQLRTEMNHGLAEGHCHRYRRSASGWPA